MIEWIRWTVFLTTSLVGVNLFPVFNLMSINIPYGLVVMIIALITRFGEQGSLCSEEGVQAERGNFLAL